ncbi:MAG: RNA polymerase-binding protein DksA [Proteobacteria bacterium]|nr:RNA polymerase-binding protein DksA [Pseudomonadota bacterium]
MSKATGSKTAKPKAAAKKPIAKSKSAAKGGAPIKTVAKSIKAKTPAAAKSTAAKTVVKEAQNKGTGKTVQPVSKSAPPPKPATTTSVPARTLAVAKSTASKKSEGTVKKMAARVKIADIVLPPGYKPSEDEPFMNDMHKAYFRKRLLDWKDEILRQTRETLAILHEDSAQHADLADRATSETDRATELRTRDRQRKLIAKIDAALGRIEDGSYGYCEDTGEPIGLKRLDARPIATLSVEAQERHERRERVYREE